MSPEAWGGIGGLIVAVGGLVASFYKLGSASTKVIVDSSLGSVQMSDADRDEARAQLAREKAERAAEKAEHDQYRKDVGAHIAEQAAQIRGLKAELRHCEGDRERLRTQDGEKP